jgi:hypothetical protein
MHGSNTLRPRLEGSSTIGIFEDSTGEEQGTNRPSPKLSMWTVELLLGSNSAMLVENALQFIGNVGCITMLDITALHHVDQFPIPEKRQ